MKTKISLAALALSAALMALPSGASAGFVRNDDCWKRLDARMQYVMSFKWLCRDWADRKHWK